MEEDLVRLGTYATKRAAIAARTKYWKDRAPLARRNFRYAKP
jgi:hypothetical protein